jgi:hypothetical protein
VIVPQHIGRAKPSRDRKGAGRTPHEPSRTPHEPSRDRKGAGLTPFSIAREHGSADRQTHLIRQPACVTCLGTSVPALGLPIESQFVHGRASLRRAVRNMLLR